MIDEKKLIMAIANWQMGLKLSWKSQADTVIYNILEEVVGLIEEQPTIQPQGIDKDRLIEEMEKLKLNKLMNVRAYSVMSHTLDLVKDIINQQPTSDGWIPCSERLPDKPETYEEDSYLIQDYQIVTPYSAYWNGEIWTDVDGKIIVNVLAWQPLPQPYKE